MVVQYMHRTYARFKNGCLDCNVQTSSSSTPEWLGLVPGKEGRKEGKESWGLRTVSPEEVACNKSYRIVFSSLYIAWRSSLTSQLYWCDVMVITWANEVTSPSHNRKNRASYGLELSLDGANTSCCLWTLKNCTFTYSVINWQQFS